MNLLDECTLLGASLLGAQKLEFALYGVVSHLSHAYDGKKDKRFTELTPEQFLRGSVDDLKLTLGQLEMAFGEKLLISNDDLKEFIKDRNLIAHNYWRLVKTNVNGAEKLENPEEFLKRFIDKCEYWQSVLNGFLWLFMLEAAKKEGRIEEVTLSERQQSQIMIYREHVEKNA
ncbi:hypothetical protein P3564_23225 [Vibrio parahaemolyticus]|nr:hypothetical protein [Vibrio parahaemolyticus]